MFAKLWQGTAGKCVFSNISGFVTLNVQNQMKWQSKEYSTSLFFPGWTETNNWVNGENKDEIGIVTYYQISKQIIQIMSFPIILGTHIYRLKEEGFLMGGQ